jgi:hypothetical protein
MYGSEVNSVYLFFLTPSIAQSISFNSSLTDSLSLLVLIKIKKNCLLKIRKNIENVNLLLKISQVLEAYFPPKAPVCFMAFPKQIYLQGFHCF